MTKVFGCWEKNGTKYYKENGKKYKIIKTEEI